MAELVLNAVDKIYRTKKKAVHAVKDFNLTVKSGEIVALLGSSGCGKTSTLRMIAGFEDVSNGTITLGGKPIHTLPPSQRGVAMAFERKLPETLRRLHTLYTCAGIGCTPLRADEAQRRTVRPVDAGCGLFQKV